MIRALSYVEKLLKEKVKVYRISQKNGYLGKLSFKYWQWYDSRDISSKVENKDSPP